MLRFEGVAKARPTFAVLRAREGQGEGLRAQTAPGPSSLLLAAQPSVSASLFLGVWLLQVSDILCIHKLDANCRLHGAKPLHSTQVCLGQGMVPAPGGLE